MSVKSNVREAVNIRIDNSQLPTSLAKKQKDLSLLEALEIVRIILSDLPWWKKIIFSLKALIGGIEEYLEEEGYELDS